MNKPGSYAGNQKSIQVYTSVFIYSHDKTKAQSPNKQKPVQIVPHK